MPYNNRYNRKIADEYDSINERYVKHIGEEYPMQGGSLDTGFDSKRIVGGARGVDEYVRNVLEGTYMIPTQAMPSSSMSGLGFSAGMRKYKQRKDLSKKEIELPKKLEKVIVEGMKKTLEKPKKSKKSGGALVEEIVMAMPMSKKVKKMEKVIAEEMKKTLEKPKKSKKLGGAIVEEITKIRKPNRWLEHVKIVRSQLPTGLPYKEVLKKARETYK
jgi:hypothetical protein